jgi:predicted ATPase/DNA-binding CsgD family transcriptional regulator/transcriptional regulator with XRE-family HTH domain
MATGDERGRFGVLLQRHRIAAALTQEELAERAGVSRRAVADLERGARRSPHPATVRQLAAALKLTDTDRTALIAAGHRHDTTATTRNGLSQSAPPDEREPDEHRSHAAVQPVLDEAKLRSKPQSITQHNLPIMLGSFIGREKEQAEVLQLVVEQGIRLVTLTGPGGVGKTRLAVKVVRQLGQHFQDGVVFVSLAPVSDPGLVPAAIAQALDVREVRNVPLLQTLQVHLQRRAMLLLLDNFEHVVAAAPVVADLLTSCARLHVVVTSRAPLHIRGEYEVAVLPLGLPESNISTAPEEVLGTDAARLFYERARAIRADFAITPDNVAAVAEICRRVDGLPLAIELAAARVKVLPPAALLAHLQRRLPILTGGARDLPSRQKTLWETIAWSYQLLGRSHQQLFRRLTVFVGGCTFSAVASVCLEDGHAPGEVLDALAALVDQSLLKPVESAGTEPRYHMLETIREYGLEQLAASGEVETLARRHADYFVALAEDAEPGLAGANWRTWRRQLQAERENLRAALDWAVAWGQTDIALRLIGSLWRWFRPDAIAEGRRWSEQALALPGGAVQPRAKALYAFGVVAMQQGDYRLAASAWKESISIWRAVGDQPRLADTLMFLASIYRPDARAVPVLLDESIALARQVGDPRRLALALGFLGWQVLQSIGPDAARPLLAEALPLARTPGDPWELIWVLYVSGLLAVREGDEETAHHRFGEALELAREARDHMMAALALAANGRAALHRHDIARATTQFYEGLRLAAEAGFEIGVAYNLEGIALVCSDRDQLDRAARFLGAAEAAYALVEVPGLVPYSALVDRANSVLRVRLGQDGFAAAQGKGRSLRREDAIDEAMRAAADDMPTSQQSANAGMVRAADRLTHREIEVLQLLAAGHSNPEIAAALVISVKTVERHLANVYAKIGAASRIDAATYAVTRGLYMNTLIRQGVAVSDPNA